MRFYSVLYQSPSEGPAFAESGQPQSFVDLALDQIVVNATRGRRANNLTPIYNVPLSDPDAIRYRQEVVHDLRRADVMAAVASFVDSMQGMRQRLDSEEKSRYRYERQRWFFSAVRTYCVAVRTLVETLQAAEPSSRGLLALLAYLRATTEADAFLELERETTELLRALEELRYTVRIKGNAVHVYAYAGEADYSTQVLSTFEKFSESPAKDYRVKPPAYATMNHIEAQIVECVAKLFPETFARLGTYSENNQGYLDERLVTFDREVQFYLGYLEHIARLERGGLTFCQPELVKPSDNMEARGMFDLALAATLVSQAGTVPPAKSSSVDPNAPHAKSQVVLNDVHLGGEERFLVITGPNQGGKTTFARAIGQLHYLAALGLPVPAAQAKLPTFDRLFTHFQRQEQVDDLRGALHDELLRIHTIVEDATGSSLIVMNEALSTTTAADALAMLRVVLGRIDQLGARCVLVTFLDELASFNEHTVSMVGNVDPADAVRHTYQFVRRAADGRAFAIALAAEHRLTKDALAERMQL